MTIRYGRSNWFCTGFMFFQCEFGGENVFPAKCKYEINHTLTG